MAPFLPYLYRNIYILKPSEISPGKSTLNVKDKIPWTDKTTDKTPTSHVEQIAHVGRKSQVRRDMAYKYYSARRTLHRDLEKSMLLDAAERSIKRAQMDTSPYLPSPGDFNGWCI